MKNDEENPWVSKVEIFGQDEMKKKLQAFFVFQAPRMFPYHLLWSLNVLAKGENEKTIFLALVKLTAFWERGRSFVFFDISFLKRNNEKQLQKIWYMPFPKSQIQLSLQKAIKWPHLLTSWIVTMCHSIKVTCDIHQLVMSSDVTSRCDLRAPLISKYECVRKHFRARFR